MKVLVVGAGAVGQVYGLYFQRGGAEVSFYVKAKYVQELQEGMTLFPLNQGRRPNPIRLTSYQIISDNQEVLKTKWDVVLITLPSDALYTPWLASFAASINREASIISLQPGSNDRLELLKFFPDINIVAGVITLISFSTPLGDEGPQEKGMAYWLPPFSKALFDGDSTKVQPVLEILRTGGFPVARKEIITDPGFVYFGSTFLNIFVRNLEMRDWKLAAFKDKEFCRLLKDSTLEGFEIIARKYSLPKPFMSFFLRETFYRLILLLSLKLMPFDLEKYLQRHFMKVGPQMKKNLHDLIAEGESVNAPMSALMRLK